MVRVDTGNDRCRLEGVREEVGEVVRVELICPYLSDSVSPFLIVKINVPFLRRYRWPNSGVTGFAYICVCLFPLSSLVLSSYVDC